jgi:hypothetical protein
MEIKRKTKCSLPNHHLQVLLQGLTVLDKIKQYYA